MIRLKKGLLSAVGVLFLIIAGWGPSTVLADDDHEEAQRAVQAGKILPLRTILKIIGQTHAGEVIKVELDHDDDDDDGESWVYEIKILQPSGRRIELEVDASSGRILDVDED